MGLDAAGLDAVSLDAAGLDAALIPRGLSQSALPPLAWEGNHDDDHAHSKPKQPLTLVNSGRTCPGKILFQIRVVYNGEYLLMPLISIVSCPELPLSREPLEV